MPLPQSQPPVLWDSSCKELLVFNVLPILLDHVTPLVPNLELYSSPMETLVPLVPLTPPEPVTLLATIKDFTPPLFQPPLAELPLLLHPVMLVELEL